MKIREVAMEFGISPSALRFYERKGLLPNICRHRGIRHYSPKDVKLIGLIQLAKRAGFSIAEIRDLLRGIDWSRKPSPTWRKRAVKKQIEIQHTIAQSNSMLAVLDTMLNCESPSIEDCCNSYAEIRNH